MQERIQQELEMLRRRFPRLEYVEAGHWIKVPQHRLATGWNRTETDVVFQIPVGYPGTPPYGIYVTAGILFNSKRPNNYTEPAPTQPPFSGPWGIFSWAPAEGQWRPTGNLSSGSNLLNWLLGFSDRFREGI
jgi:hypothetical protein